MPRNLLLTSSASLLFCIFFSGCNAINPQTRVGLWQPVGANEKNIQAMLQNPADYSRGHGENHSTGSVAAIAAHRYAQDKIPDLPSTSQDGFTPGGGSSSSSSSSGNSGSSGNN